MIINFKACHPAGFNLFTQLFIFVICGDHTFHSRRAKCFVFQHSHACDGASAGGADRILQSAGMLAGGEEHPCSTLHGGGGIDHSLLPGQTAGNSAISQGFDHHVHIRRAAAGQGAGGIDKIFLQGIHNAAGGHVGQSVGQSCIVHQFVAAVQDRALAHSGGGVGHDADDGQLDTDHAFNFLDFHTGGHGDDQRLL